MAAVFLKLSEVRIVGFLPVSSGMRDTASINLVVTKEQVIVYIQPHTHKKLSNNINLNPQNQGESEAKLKLCP